MVDVNITFEQIMETIEDSRQAATAKRIAACWNACRGIPTEMLAATDPQHQPVIYAALVKQINELRGELKIALNREAS